MSVFLYRFDAQINEVITELNNILKSKNVTLKTKDEIDVTFNYKDQGEAGTVFIINKDGLFEEAK